MHLCAGFAPENVVLVAGMNEVKSSFCAISFHCFSSGSWWVFISPRVTSTSVKG